MAICIAVNQRDFKKTVRKKRGDATHKNTLKDKQGQADLETAGRQTEKDRSSDRDRYFRVIKFRSEFQVLYLFFSFISRGPELENKLKRKYKVERET